MRIDYTTGGPARQDRRVQAEALARAAHLRLLLVSEARFPRARAVLETDGELAATLLGLREAQLLDVDPREGAELEQVLLSLAFRLGTEVRCCAGSGRRLLVYDDFLLRRHLAARGSMLAAASTRDLERAVLAAEPDPQPSPGMAGRARRLLARALHGPAPVRARLHARAPVLVYSTPGVPRLVRTHLAEHLETLEALGHRGVPVVVLDDSAEPEPMRRALDELRESSCQPILHLPERSPGGGPGEKARLRARLVSALGAEHGPSVAATAEQCFGPGLAGSANLGFWLLADRTTVWLDQDARPCVTRARRASMPTESAAGFDPHLERVRRVDTLSDLSVTGDGELLVEPVDLLHQVDLALDCDPRVWTGRLAAAGWPTHEDAGYDRVRGAPGPVGPVRICTFHTCGHRDYRARLLHDLVLSGSLSAEETAACLAGRLPFYEAVERPALAAAVDASKSGFGTAIAFSAELPLRPAMMLATRLRLVDFSIGAFQRFAGDFGTAWSPLALSHYREDATGSGRGPLAAYTWNEDRAQLLMNVLHDVFLDCVDPPDGRLLRCAGRLRALGDTYDLAGSATLGLWASTSASVAALASRPDAATRAYANALRKTFLATGRPRDRREFHRRTVEACRAELTSYARQLELWDLLPGAPPPADVIDSIPD